MRSTLTTVAEILGAMSITVGATLANTALGLVVGGVLLIAGSVLVVRSDA